MKIKTAQLQVSGVLINGSINLPNGNTGHIRTSYNEWLELGNEPDETQEINTASKDELITTLEAQITPRNIRGALLNDSFAINHINNIDAQIAILRSK